MLALATSSIALVSCDLQSPSTPNLSGDGTPKDSLNPSSADPHISNNRQLPTPSFTVSLPLPEPVSTTTKPWNIAVVLKTSGHSYWRRVGQATESLGTDLGVDVQVHALNMPQSAEFVEQQIILMSELIDQEAVDGLILGPADSIRLVPIIEKAIAKDIAVIILDTPVDSDNILSFVGFDNFAAGETVGQWVVEQLDGTGNILILEGGQHHDNAIERHQGFLSGLKTGQMQILASQSANWHFEEAETLTRQWLEQYPNIDAIVAANDQMALGAIAALEAHGTLDDVLVTGFDGSQVALTAVQTKKLAATIDQIPEEQAHIALQLLVNHLEQRQPLPPEILLKNNQLITVNSF